MSIMTVDEAYQLMADFERLELAHIYERNAFCSCGELVKNVQGHAVHKSYLLLAIVRGRRAEEFTAYDTSQGHCGLCGRLTCNGGCFK